VNIIKSILTLLFIFVGNDHAYITLVINRYIEVDRAAADLAVFDIILFWNGAIDEDVDAFAAVGAVYFSGFEFVHEGLFLLVHGHDGFELQQDELCFLRAQW
jgi:hypothetical protein